MMKYLYLSSIDSLDYHPHNNYSDFTVELPQTLYGLYDCALGAISYTSDDDEPLYIYCDIIETSYINNAQSPILRIVDSPGEVNNLYYVTTTVPDVHRVRIKIRTVDGASPSSDLGVVRCTLLLEPIKD